MLFISLITIAAEIVFILLYMGMNCRRIRMKSTPKKSLFFIQLCICFIGLVLSFELIYCAFFFEIGFPPGSMLNSSDWLSFLGSYLGFAGSLIMAVLVYKQDKKINDLTLQEYQTSFKLSIERSDRFVRYSRKEYEDYVIRDPLGGADVYIKHDVLLSGTTMDYKEKDIPYICFKLTNAGRLGVSDVVFNSISIKTLSSAAKELNYLFDNGPGGNIWNGKHVILPMDSIMIGLVLHSFELYVGSYQCDMNISYCIGNIQQTTQVIFFCKVSEINSRKKIQFIDGKSDLEC